MNKSEQLEKKGYVVLPNVLSADEVKSVRARLKEIFSKESIFPGDLHANGKIGFVYADVFNRYPELNWIFQKEELLSGLRSLLGDDFVFLPESALHHAGYGGMHKDTNAQEKAGYTFHWDNDFNVVQVGIYLQDNHPEYAGGLDVIPGSNHVRWGVQPNKLASIIKRNWNRLARKIGLRSSQKSLFTKAGDAAVRIAEQLGLPAELIAKFVGLGISSVEALEGATVEDFKESGIPAEEVEAVLAAYAKGRRS
jgi:hypothetical protein